MDQLNQFLSPLVQDFPVGLRDFLEAGGWFIPIGFVLLLLIYLLVLFLRLLSYFGFFQVEVASRKDDPLAVDLANCPPPKNAPGPIALLCYHVPVRLRFVVLAPQGKDETVDPASAYALLDRVIPGLAQVAAVDAPFVRVWPAQVSHHGFTHAFHRCTLKPDPEGQPSRWVLVAGRAILGKQSLLLGLGLEANEPATIGRLTLEPHQWLDALRIR